MKEKEKMNKPSGNIELTEKDKKIIRERLRQLGYL